MFESWAPFLMVFSFSAQHEAARRGTALRVAAWLEGSAGRGRSTRIEIGQRMVVEQPSPAIGDGDQLHFAATMETPNRWLWNQFGLDPFRQNIAPTQVEPDQHADPTERQAAVGTRKAIVTQPQEPARQRVLEETPQELVARDASRVRRTSTAIHGRSPLDRPRCLEGRCSAKRSFET